MGVPTSFIFCHAEAPFCARKSCVVERAVLLAARHLALACHQLEKAYRCLCFCDCQWYKKLLVLCLSMTLQRSKILHSFKSTTLPKTFCSLIASDDEADNQSLAEAFHVSTYSGITWDNIIHLQCLSFWRSCKSFAFAKCAESNWQESALV